ncbi:MAG: chromate transporter [Chthoniobacterales bacterium]|nr:chromate transporter [Chthoniobacterales bacterium]
MTSLYLVLAKIFSILSFSAFGGGNTIIPSLHEIAVVRYHWITNQEFLDLFSISKAAPGPTTLIVELIGMKATGFSAGSHGMFVPALLGAMIAVAAMFLPSSLLFLVVAHFWEKFQGKPWQLAIQKALMPITAGLILGSTWTVAQTALSGWLTGVIALLGLIIILRTKTNPILIMAVAAVVSWIIWG